MEATSGSASSSTGAATNAGAATDSAGGGESSGDLSRESSASGDRPSDDRPSDDRQGNEDQGSDEQSPIKIPSLAELLANAAAALKAKSTGKPSEDGLNSPGTNPAGDGGIPPTT